MDAAFLRGAPLFAELTDEQLARLARICRPQTYTAGATIFKEGEPGNRLFLVVSGEVRVRRRIPGAGEEALAILKPGACFGEMAVFDRSERSTDAVAHQACTLASLARSDLERLLEFEPELGYRLLLGLVRLLSARLRTTNDQVRAVMTMAMF
jgi:CRP-like cAMP-binding protein